jgi:uncharacterized membrane protein
LAWLHLPLQFLQIEFHKLPVTLAADAVAELPLGMFSDVVLHPLPVVLVVSDLFALTTDRQQSRELLDAHERHLFSRLSSGTSPAGFSSRASASSVANGIAVPNARTVR